MKNNLSLRFIQVILLWAVCSTLGLSAQRVDTVAVHSTKMDLDVKNIVIVPAGYDNGEQKQYPVLYLLHGYSGSYTSWLYIKPELPQLASQLQMIIVCPDGKNSWYWDSPIDPKSQYDTYMSSELVSYVDSHYPTIASVQKRAIAGLSMGGHGALWLAINHPDVFGACGSMSGGVDIRPFPNNWEMAKALLGSYTNNKARWDAHTVITHVDKLAANKTPLIVDCGQDDFFLKVNENLHTLLVAKKIPHTYIMSSGEHNVAYWSKAIDWQLAFFDKVFRGE